MKYIVAVCLLAGAVSAATITVDINGAGDHTTIAAGVAAAGAGDTVLVKDGDYGEQLTVSKTGSAGSPVVIRSENQYGAVLRGMDVAGNYITVERLEFSGNDAYGVDGSSCSHIRVTDNRFVNITAGKYTVFTGDYGYVARNMMKDVRSGVHLKSHSLAEYNRITGLLGPRSNIFFFFKGDSITMRGNYMWQECDYSTWADWVDDDGSHFFTTWDDGDHIPSRDILIEGNIGFNAAHASEPTSTGTHLSERFTYRNNVFVNSYHVGICTKYISEVKIYNNTLINCGAYPVWLQNSPRPGNMVKNNIIAYTATATWVIGRKDQGIFSEGVYPPECDNNLYYGIRPYSPMGSNSLYTFPLFVNPAPFDTAVFDFSLQATSPAVDAGCDVDFFTDLRGSFRPAGAVDIGAYEYDAAAPVHDNMPLPAAGRTGVRISPVPVQGNMTVTGTGALGAVEVLGLDGHIVWQGQTDALRLSIGNPGLQPGQYLVRTGNGVRAFVVTR